MIKFLIINSYILSNPNFLSSEKLVLSYVELVKRYNKVAWSDEVFMSRVLGADVSAVRDTVTRLVEFGVLSSCGHGLSLAKSPDELSKFLRPFNTKDLPAPGVDCYLKAGYTVVAQAGEVVTLLHPDGKTKLEVTV